MANSDFRIPFPVDWQRFERICCKLWALEWNDPNTQLNGRSGQKQNGVDVWGCLNGDKYNVNAIQCKGKDKYNHKGITKHELLEEVSKAKGFDKNLKSFTLATTAPSDVSIQEYARELSYTHPFRINVASWDDICLLLDKHQEVYNIYFQSLSEPQNKNKNLIQYWYELCVFSDFEFNTTTLINQNYNIEYRSIFLNKIVSFSTYFSASEQGFNRSEIDPKLFKKFNFFNQCVVDINDFITTTNDLSAKQHSNCRNDLYWVLDTHLEYHLKGDYIETQKLTLKYLFMNLIRITNTILVYANRSYGFNFNLNQCIIDAFNSEFFTPVYGENESYDTASTLKTQAKNQIENRNISNFPTTLGWFSTP